MPIPNSPQEEALRSEADHLFFGGAAGGGKSDLLIGLALVYHTRSIIFRREVKQVLALIDRTAEVLGTRQGLNGQDKVWRFPSGKQLEFGGCQNAGDESGYQGRPHDLKGFDELPQFLESQFRFLCGWNRTTNPQQKRVRVVGAGNPPTDAEGDWVVDYWAPWLSPEHDNPALPGELRWFAGLPDEKDKEVESGAAFEYKGEVIHPKSRTFIPSRVEDNPYLMASGYKATLQAMPEPLRSQMLRGDFRAGKEDNPWQVIPSAWVEMAQERWKETPKPKVKMTSLGVDPARGGPDETVLAPRYGDWFDELVCYPGTDTPDGPMVASLAVSRARDGCVMAVDVIGVGTSVYDHLRTNVGSRVVAMNGAEKSITRDRTNSLGFVNQRAEWYWRMREALDPAHESTLCLPPDPRLRADLCAARWRLVPRGVQIESKEDIKERIGRSPDRGDAVVYALAKSRSHTTKINYPKKNGVI